MNLKFFNIVAVLFFVVSTAFAGDVITISDLEGRTANLDALLAQGLLKRNAAGALEFADKKTQLVFNGDLFNRGSHNISLLRDFSNLKKQFPDRVVLTWGNHDLSLLRFVKDYPALEKQFKGQPAELVKSWFSEMGLSNQLEAHRTELESLLKRPVTETEAAKEFIKMALPGGERFEYLRLGQLGHYQGNKLWVHGGVTDRNYGKIPGSGATENNPRVWVDKLNKWGKTEIDKVAAQFNAGKPVNSNLVFYGDAIWDPEVKRVFPSEFSVVYPDRFKDGSNLRLPPDHVIEQLQKYGIDYVIVGHTPMGNIPVPLKKGTFTYFMGDTSYSQMGENSFTVANEKGLHVRATTGAGEKLDYWVSPKDKKIGLMADDFHVIGKTAEGDYLLFQYYEKYKINEKKVSPADLHQYKLNEAKFVENTEVTEHLRVLNDFLVEKKIPVRTYAELAESLKHQGKVPVLFSGASKFTNPEASQNLIRKEMRAMLKKMDPTKHTIITGGTDFGVEKIVHEEVDAFNAAAKGAKFEMGAFIIDQTTPKDLHLSHDWMVYSGHDWDEPLLRGLDLVKEREGKAIFVGGGGFVAAGIKKAAAMDADFRLMSNVQEGASVKYAQVYPKNAFSSGKAVDFSGPLLSVKQTPAEVVASMKGSGKKVLTFVGFSGMGYENPKELEKIVKRYLTTLNPKEWIVNIGVTPEGVGKAYQWAKELDSDPMTQIWKYAKEFKEAGFETRGVVSSQAFRDLNDITKLEFIDNKTRFEYVRKYVDAFHIVEDKGWGGYVDGKLTPTSEAMVECSDVMVGVGGGAVGRDELTEGIKRGKRVSYHVAEMNHELAFAKAKRQGKPMPTEFYGEAYEIKDMLKTARRNARNGCLGLGEIFP